ncbi:hypothetical protein [Trinickia terrae]|uniref:hypothetical protein n=1 Tax=Trinickia terrae TaxID=2571161 RepID=UPI00146BD4D0|nr:hypothetical protein [Trinickia terrae]
MAQAALPRDDCESLAIDGGAIPQGIDPIARDSDELVHRRLNAVHALSLAAPD